MTITLTPEVEAALCREAARQNKPAEEIASKVFAQSLGLPRKPLPPGKTLKNVLDALPEPEWSEDETDEKLLAALKARG